MKYYLPSEGQTAADARDIPKCWRDVDTAAELIAGEIHYRDPCAEFPLDIVVVDDEGKTWRCDVKRLTLPHFVALVRAME